MSQTSMIPSMIPLDDIDVQIVRLIVTSDHPVSYREAARINPEHTRALLEQGVLVRDALCNLIVNVWLPDFFKF